MTDNKMYARIPVFAREGTKLRNRRRKNVPDEVIDAYYEKRLAALRADGMPIDREAEIELCVEACNCTRGLARAGLGRQFPMDEGERHRGGRGKRLR